MPAFTGHTTGHADLPHPALGQDFTPSPTTRRVQAQSNVRARGRGDRPNVPQRVRATYPPHVRLDRNLGHGSRGTGRDAAVRVAGNFGVMGSGVFRSDHIAGPETAGHAPRRRTLHH